VRFRELHGKTLGIVGFGRIGRRTAEIAKAAFAMRVLVYEREREPDLVAHLGMERVERLEDLLAEADVVSLHLTLRPETRGIIGAAELARMKPTAILVNTARGGLIDEVALTEALRAGRIAGAALDVVAHEPLASDHPLAGLANVALSPHTGGGGDGTDRGAGRPTGDSGATGRQTGASDQSGSVGTPPAPGIPVIRRPPLGPWRRRPRAREAPVCVIGAT
jgi:D-3-phosphoglycerate dehydrogenase